MTGIFLPVVDEMLRFARGRLAKAAQPAALAARQQLLAEAQPTMAAIGSQSEVARATLS